MLQNFCTVNYFGTASVLQWLEAIDQGSRGSQKGGGAQFFWLNTNLKKLSSLPYHSVICVGGNLYIFRLSENFLLIVSLTVVILPGWTFTLPETFPILTLCWAPEKTNKCFTRISNLKVLVINTLSAEQIIC